MNNRKIIVSLIIILICVIVLQIVSTFSGKVKDSTTPPTPPPPIIKNSDSRTPSGKVKDTTTPPTPPPPIVSKYKTFAEVPNVPNGQFNYGGSTSWAPIRKIVDEKIKTAQQGFRMRYINPTSDETPGSSTGIRMLLDNRLHFSVSSRPLTSEEKQQGLIEQKVAVDGIAIAVNPKLNIEGLTVDQLKGIYTGKIKNWTSIVSNINQDIKPYTRDPKDGATADYLIHDVLNIKSKELGSNVTFTEDTTHGLREVRKNLGGIYFASASEVVQDCNTKPLPIGQTLDKFVTPYKPPFITRDNQCPRFKSKMKVNTEAFRSGQYPITRPLFVIIKSNDPRKQQAGEFYANLLLTAQGQKLLEEAGYASLYDNPDK